METPQRRQKSWLSSLTGLVSGSRSSAQDTANAVAAGVITGKKTDTPASNGDAFSYRLRAAQAGHTTPSRYSGTFSAPPVESPESPVKRASPSQLAQRRMHERAQGPSGRAGAASAHSTSARGESNKGYHSVSFDSHLASTPKRTNFSSATTPRNIFRDSMSRDMPAFTFTPRVPPNSMKGSFPATTPGRSFRASGIELSSQDMAKTSFSELFAMKIPDPDPKLSGEAIAGMVPKDLKAGSRSVYANEYLAHLCPPDFSEEQRNQFFCILDLRRLKYAADEVFIKKDWKLNILNFAKEYEKNRSLIMLRYGLYEFKTVKVSKDVFQKWKADNNIPDLMEEDEPEDATMTGNSATVPKSLKLNGTEGILQSGKRKAQDVIDPAAMESSGSTFSANKRSRPSEAFKTEREPETERSTPLNQSKRKAAQNSNAEQIQRAKIQKATPNPPSAATSATRALFEKCANSPSKEPAAAETPSILVSKPFGESASLKASPFKPNATGQLPKPSSGSLARSVLESGLKTTAGPAGGNIFGYLSDASSAKGSGNDNADADAEDTDESDGQEEPEAQVSSDSTRATTNGTTNATAKSAPSLFSAKPAGSVPGAAGALTGSSASSDVSETATGRSLFDRVNKTTDGQPIRVFGAESNSSPFAAPTFGAKAGASERPSLEKEPALFGGNKTWSPDTPIKFAGGNSSTPAKPLFGASTTNSGSASAASTTPNLFAAASKETKSDAPPSLFGSVSAPKETKAAAPTSLFGSAAAPKDTKADAPVSLFGSKAPATMFGSTSKDAPQSASTTAAASASEAQPAAAPAFGFLNKPAGPGTPAAPSLFGASTAGSGTPAGSLFGKAQEQPATTTAASLFGNAAGASKPASGSVLQSQTLFGGAPKPDVQPQGLKRTSDDKGSSSAAPSSGASIFGGALKNGTSSKDEPQAKRPLFGSSTPSSQAPSSAPLFSFGSTNTNGVSGAAKASGESAKPLFGSTTNGSAAEPAKTQATSLFGSTTTAAANPVSGSIFNFGNTNSSTAAPVSSSFSIGAPTSAQDSAPPAPMFGGGNTVSAPSSFTFSVGGDTSNQGFHNPFSFGGAGAEAAPSLSFGGVASATASSSPFQFGSTTTSAAAPPAAGGMSFSFGAGSQPSSQAASTAPASLFGGAPAASGGANGSSMFSFGGGGQAQASSTPIFGQQQQQQPALGGSMFNLAPPVGGTSTGTNTPFTTLGGASSLATTPATGTPEPGAAQDNSDHNGHQADGDEAPQEQINLTEGGPGEEDEAVAYEVRAKALRLAPAKEADGGSPAAKDKKSPWKTEGVGALRVLKHKTTGAVRLLLRAEPRGNVALNRVLLADFNYKPEPNAKYVKLTTSNEAGTGLETWMLQVKTKEAAQKLAEALEEHKLANKK